MIPVADSHYPFALIFDMDGVMVNNHHWHFLAWQEFCRVHGIRISEELFYEKLFGGNNHDTLVNIFQREFDPREVRLMGEQKEVIYREMYAPHIKEVAGLAAFVNKARSNHIPMAIASSAPLENIFFTLSHLRLSDHFDAMVHSGMISHGKPHPEIFQRAAELLKKKPGECIVFEDSIPGFTAARAAGCFTIALATTLPSYRIDGVKHILNDFSGLGLDWLQKIYSEA